MLNGRRMHDWILAANHMTLLANCNRDPKRKATPYRLYDFLPHDIRRELRMTKGIRMTRETLHALKPLFTEAGNGP